MSYNRSIRCKKRKFLRKQKQMKTVTSQHCFSQVAKQAGFMPTYWSAIEISNDRQPENSRVLEGAGYA